MRWTYLTNRPLPGIVIGQSVTLASSWPPPSGGVRHGNRWSCEAVRANPWELTPILLLVRGVLKCHIKAQEFSPNKHCIGCWCRKTNLLRAAAAASAAAGGAGPAHPVSSVFLLSNLVCYLAICPVAGCDQWCAECTAWAGCCREPGKRSELRIFLRAFDLWWLRCHTAIGNLWFDMDSVFLWRGCNTTTFTSLINKHFRKKKLLSCLYNWGNRLSTNWAVVQCPATFVLFWTASTKVYVHMGSAVHHIRLLLLIKSTTSSLSLTP